PEGRQKAIRNLRQNDVDALVVIGGNGSQSGASALNEDGFPAVGVASTIDNDLLGSTITIGVDTALNIALEAIDRLKVTASSHSRAFLVEVMGRDCGYLALMAGIAGGAEAVLIPEVATEAETVVDMIQEAYMRGKKHAMIVVADGAKYNAEALINYCEARREELGFDMRATILGHVQRGGAPTAFDRILATRLGAGAIHSLARGETGVLVGVAGDRIMTTPLKEVAGKTKGIDLNLYNLSNVLAK
ncbi:MAG: ATP-dependent 6-phosphofructokinase, partial [Chloroflexi bacterium]|nr:ATP-dependent 6-phosphofructokinase [Chloroflexota bacterium]